MRNLIAGFLILFFSSWSQATSVLSTGVGMRSVEETSGYGSRNFFPLSVSAGYLEKYWGALLEYSTYSTEDRNGMVSVDTRYHDLVAILRWHPAPRWMWRPYFSIGGGSEWSVIRSTYADTSNLSTGLPKAIWLAGLGVESRRENSVNLGTELRALSIESSTPFEMGVHLSYHW